MIKSETLRQIYARVYRTAKKKIKALMKHFRCDSGFCVYIGATTYFEEYQGGRYTYLLDKVNCNGTEVSILDCKHSGKLSPTYKGGGRARVICKGIH